MKVWITKYALTQGIFETDGKRDAYCPSAIIIPACDKLAFTTYFSGRDWHTNKIDAVIRAEEMRKNKIKTLEKQLAVLKKLSFEVTN
jgi:hypothetical protein